MFNFLWSPRQEARLGELGERGRDARRAQGRNASELESVEHQLDRLTLACAALWSLLKEHGHTEEELLARMHELDLRDGKLDGKITPDAVTCGSCGHSSRAGRRACLYCGAALPPGPVFGASP